jgi:enoyl-CoA hydratase/carnithine racemase
VAELETILYDERDGVAWITLNRPEVHNAFNRRMQEELRAVWTSLRRNDDVRVAVLTGAGEQAFCTGIDRAEAMAHFSEPAGDPGGAGDSGVGSGSTPYMFDDPGRNICPKQCDLWKPVIAAVNGMACGGALYMLGEVDIIIAAEHATFFDPHVTYGMVSGFESIHLLQKLPLGETLRVVLLGASERMSAARAHELGLVSELAPLAELADRAAWIAGEIAAMPPLAVQGTLRAVWAGQEHTWRQALELAYTWVGMGSDRANLAAGQASFSSGRRKEWRLR